MPQPINTTDDPAEAILRFPATQDWVVLLHGLFASRRSMQPIESRLVEQGYQVWNWGYSTWWRQTQQHIDRLVPQIRDLQSAPHVRSICFVTHSMGGILVRAALDRADLAKVNRIVMLSPPNRGSRLTRLPPGPAAWLVPALADLRETPDSLPNRLPPLRGVEIGVIAAKRDVVVRVEETSLASQADHCTLPTTHFRLPQHSEAIDKTLCFLEHGSFTPPVRAAA